MRSARRPRVLVPLSRPIANPIDSSTANLAEPSDRSCRIAIVSWPWTVRTEAHFLFPASVRGPVLAPPCRRHVLLPTSVVAVHRWPVALNTAAQRLHGIVFVCSMVVIVALCNVTVCKVAPP